jgi:hypothetical protein
MKKNVLLIAMFVCAVLMASLTTAEAKDLTVTNLHKNAEAKLVTQLVGSSCPPGISVVFAEKEIRIVIIDNKSVIWHVIYKMEDNAEKVLICKLPDGHIAPAMASMFYEFETRIIISDDKGQIQFIKHKVK